MSDTLDLLKYLKNRGHKDAVLNYTKGEDTVSIGIYLVELGYRVWLTDDTIVVEWS